MKSKFYKILFIVLFCSFFFSCVEKRISNEVSDKQKIIVVKVPPFYDDRFSEEQNYRRFQDFLFPPNAITKGAAEDKIPAPKSLPNDDSMLTVSVNESGKLKLNFYEDQGEISNTEPLTKRLKELFREREKAGVYEPENWKIIKVVGIEAPASTKYVDFLKVAEAVSQGGADPVILLFDDDARPKIFKQDLKSNQK